LFLGRSHSTLHCSEANNRHNIRRLAVRVKNDSISQSAVDLTKINKSALSTVHAQQTVKLSGT